MLDERQRGELSLSVSFSDIEHQEEGVEFGDLGEPEINWGENNIEEVPLFVEPDSLDYRLTADSPCIDTGDPDSPEDPDGTRADMGFYPFEACVVQGYVYDHQDGEPLPNAEISLLQRTSLTDENGFWRLLLHSSDFDILVSRSDYLDTLLSNLSI